jgi:hypothetical protein
MKKPVDLQKVRQIDREKEQFFQDNPGVRRPTEEDLQEQLGGRKAGRPKGPEPTTLIAVRIPQSLVERLDRHLDRLETRHGIKTNRASITRHALKLFLDQEESR